jgi:murein L,D-transpeptidase YcbB/YkuD
MRPDHHDMIHHPIAAGKIILCCVFIVQGAMQSCHGISQEMETESMSGNVFVVNASSGFLQVHLQEASASGGVFGDSLKLYEHEIIKQTYAELSVPYLWSRGSHLTPAADSLFSFIEGAENYGLFPHEYQQRSLKAIRKVLADSVVRSDTAELAASADLLMTDAFIRLSRHLKFGRLRKDSVTAWTDTIFDAGFIVPMLHRVMIGDNVRQVLESMEPSHPDYLSLRRAVPALLDSLDRSKYTTVEYPYKDSMRFLKQLQTRLFESKYLASAKTPADSLTLSEAIRKAQAARKLTVDGKAGPALVKSLNNTGHYKFCRIAMNLDRYKHLPAQMPDRYVWVNIPSYRLQLFDTGMLVFDTKVIVGTAANRTPLLNSDIQNIVTYPHWTVPYSIIFREILPNVRRDPGYLKRRNYLLIDRKGKIIDPYALDWSKLGKSNFPYFIRQKQGDNNALGILKFNFANNYAVYLHDTNARGLFQREARSLSHGCVRVQGWKELASRLVAVDSLNGHPDSLSVYLERKEQRTLTLKSTTPIFLRYFTAFATGGKIRFLEDVYDEDKMVMEKYFSRRS